MCNCYIYSNIVPVVAVLSIIATVTVMRKRRQFDKASYQNYERRTTGVINEMYPENTMDVNDPSLHE